MHQMKLHRPTNSLITVLEVKRGWTEVKFPDGTTKTVRNGELASGSEHFTVFQEQPNDQAVDVEPKIKIELRPNHDKYVRHAERTTSGRQVYDIDDEVAGVLRGGGLDDAYFILAKHLAGDVDDEAIEAIESSLRAKYAHLNQGMQRMTVGNRIRKCFREKE